MTPRSLSALPLLALLCAPSPALAQAPEPDWGALAKGRHTEALLREALARRAEDRVVPLVLTRLEEGGVRGASVRLLLGYLGALGPRLGKHGPATVRFVVDAFAARRYPDDHLAALVRSLEPETEGLDEAILKVLVEHHTSLEYSAYSQLQDALVARGPVVIPMLMARIEASSATPSPAPYRPEQILRSLGAAARPALQPSFSSRLAAALERGDAPELLLVSARVCEPQPPDLELMRRALADPKTTRAALLIGDALGERARALRHDLRKLAGEGSWALASLPAEYFRDEAAAALLHRFARGEVPPGDLALMQVASRNTLSWEDELLQSALAAAEARAVETALTYSARSRDEFSQKVVDRMLSLIAKGSSVAQMKPLIARLARTHDGLPSFISTLLAAYGERGLPLLLETVQRERPGHVREKLARAICDLPKLAKLPDSFLPSLTRCFDTVSSETSRSCLRALDKQLHGDPRVLAILLEHVGKAERVLAIELLAGWGEAVRPHVPRLLDLYRSSEDETFRDEFLRMVSALGPLAKEAIPLLTPALDAPALAKSTSHRLELRALGAMEEHAAPYVARLTSRVLTSGVGERALRGLGKHAGPGIDVLLDAIEKSSRHHEAHHLLLGLAPHASAAQAKRLIGLYDTCTDRYESRLYLRHLLAMGPLAVDVIPIAAAKGDLDPNLSWEELGAGAVPHLVPLLAGEDAWAAGQIVEKLRTLPPAALEPLRAPIAALLPRAQREGRLVNLSRMIDALGPGTLEGYGLPVFAAYAAVKVDDRDWLRVPFARLDVSFALTQLSDPDWQVRELVARALVSEASVLLRCLQAGGSQSELVRFELLRAILAAARATPMRPEIAAWVARAHVAPGSQRIAALLRQ